MRRFRMCSASAIDVAYWQQNKPNPTATLLARKGRDPSPTRRLSLANMPASRPLLLYTRGGFHL